MVALAIFHIFGRLCDFIILYSGAIPSGYLNLNSSIEGEKSKVKSLIQAFEIEALILPSTGLLQVSLRLSSIKTMLLELFSLRFFQSYSKSSSL